ncbi:hypothetical protein ML401_35560 (plasmid) [Bradyrhizobium sp. 62B]|uniref:hypothetical protein n=1 Tax=Bradyrhizobium sp. 62B TaxID=2898442 RepID=UPI002557ED62|nr:hypothetical protein ML401_35560 [Bradyrhizobium sp. 62B]
MEPLFGLNPSTPYELRDHAHSAPAPAFAGPPASQELRDIGAIVGEGWQHGSQAASDVLIDVLGNINLLPNQFGPSQFAINSERYAATLGPRGTGTFVSSIKLAPGKWTKLGHPISSQSSAG